MGETAETWGHIFAIGADVQMHADLVAGIGFGRRLKAAVVAPDAGTGTIRHASGHRGGKRFGGGVP